MEKYEEYVDKLGRRFIAVNPSDYGYEQWFQSMIRGNELRELVILFPYVNLKSDPEGNLVPVDGVSHMGKITNMFHVMYAKWQDKFRSDYKPIDPNQQYFSWKPTEFVPEKDTPEVRNISVGGERLIWDEKDGYELKLDKLPEVINIQYPQGWHPNKDSRGFYMSPNQYNGYGYGGYNYGYNPYYYGGGGYIGAPSNPYSYTAYPWNYNSNLPRYKDGYPF